MDEAIADLEARLRRYPADRYPVQHATAQFHRGVILTNAGSLEEAESALTAAARLFDPGVLPVEHAKTLNALGATLREAGRPVEAAPAFRSAASLFEGAEQPLEHGAALFNLGLVQREAGECGSAAASFERARDLLGQNAAHGRAAAAARELGATFIALGRLEDAARELEAACQIAEGADLGGAANALGLALLGLDRADAAIDAFRTAATAHPRNVRPGEHAMAKVNLALAHAEAGDPARARLAARQALGVPGAPTAVREQADALLRRLPAKRDDLAQVLDTEPPDRWQAVVREEIVRWVDAAQADRIAEAATWIDAQLERSVTGDELASALVGALLELPTDSMEAIVAGMLLALPAQEPARRNRFRSELDRAMARFPTPQLLRLQQTFSRVAVELGQEPWS